MAGKDIIAGAQPVEWIEETSFATAEEDADWEWFGVGTSWSAAESIESESVSYLPEYGASNKLEKRMNIAHHEMWEGEITYHPQNFDLLKFFTGEDGGTSDDPPTIQVGEVNESADPEEFRRILGGLGQDFSASVDEGGTWEVTGDFIFADGESWSDSDYTGTEGSHAAEDTSEPFKYGDLSNVQYGSEPLDGAVEGLEFNVSTEVAIVRDPDEARDTLIAALIPVDREVTVDVTLTYDSFDMGDEVRAYERKDFTFDIGTYSFTIEGVQFPEMPYEFTADDLISDTVSSDPAASISWT